jgi:Protein of unknown function (DUF4232)
MRRTALALALLAMVAAAGCSGNATPSSDVTSTLLPPGSSQAASTSASPSVAPVSASAAAATPSASSPASPSAAPTPSPTPKPTPKPTPVPTPVCTSTMLTAKVTGWQGAMGSQIATVKLTNAATATCKLRGTPRLQLVDAGGHILIDSKTLGAAGLPHVSPGDKTWLLAHNGWVTTMVQVANYCGTTTPVLPTTVAFYLPSSGGRLVAAAGTGGSVPPCYGNPGDAGSIAMNGWAH